MRRNLWTMGLLLLMALSVVGCSGNKALEVEEPLEEIPTALELEAMIAQNTAAQQAQDTRTLTVYLQDATGYLVPVDFEVVAQEGIAGQALELLGEEGITETVSEYLGLCAVLPTGTRADVDIQQGLATVNLSSEALSCADAVEEYNMVAGIVQTMTEFDTVDSVQLKFNGYVLDTLAYGTQVGEPLRRMALNLESVDAQVDLTGAKTVTVYFESTGASSMVPVTRAVFSPADVDTAVLELLKGPKDEEGLYSSIPKDTALISVLNQNGVVTVNLSESFKEVLSGVDGGEAALRSILLTCSQFEDVKEVRLQVEGRALQTDAAVMNATTVVNSAVYSGETTQVFENLFD